MQLPDGVRLEVGQRVAAVGGRELADQVLARLGHGLGDQLAHAVLDGRRAAVGEELLELLGELPAVLAEDLVDLLAEVLRDQSRLVGELAVELLGALLELRAHVLGVCGGLLAVEHARADLDGVRDGLDRVVTRLLALADDARGGFVLDRQVVDGEPIAGRRDAGLPERGCRFHVGSVARYGRDLTERAFALRERPAGAAAPASPREAPG